MTKKQEMMICPEWKTCNRRSKEPFDCCKIPHEKNEGCFLGCSDACPDCIPYVEPSSPAKEYCSDCFGSGQWHREGEVISNCPTCRGTGFKPSPEMPLIEFLILNAAGELRLCGKDGIREESPVFKVPKEYVQQVRKDFTEECIKTFQTMTMLSKIVIEKIAEVISVGLERDDSAIVTARIIYEGVILALIATDRAETKEKHFNDCMAAKKSGYEEGKSEVLRKQAGLVEALETGMNELWRLRHRSNERPESTLDVIKQMKQAKDSALKEVVK